MSERFFEAGSVEAGFSEICAVPDGISLLRIAPNGRLLCLSCTMKRAPTLYGGKRQALASSRAWLNLQKHAIIWEYISDV
jgi:hypothetical protein